MNPLRVLVAEDNEDHRYLLVRALRRIAGSPLDIREARDGEEALDLLRVDTATGERDDRPHLIFLDLRMPRLDGFEVLRRVKGDPELADIPVIILSASARREDIDTAYELGTNSYVTKAEGTKEGDSLPKVAQYWTAICQLPQAHPN